MKIVLLKKNLFERLVNDMKKNIPFTKEIQVFSDDRGVFVPFLQKDALDDGLEIKRVYYVSNYGKGIIRGFHFHKKEWKYFAIVNGAAKFVAINPDNPEEIFTFVSSVRKQNLIIVPPGFANGWISLEENTILVCGSTAKTEESIKDDKRFDPYLWGDVWSVKAR
jgi:dTDP-4-dehydrorhamnose 3,5-epimerase-like enzyme